MAITSSSDFPVLPGSWLGIIGGGQLARMFCFAAQSMGYRVAVLDPNIKSVAGAVAERHFNSRFDDETALIELSNLCNAVSIEFENVPAKSLKTLACRTFMAPTTQCVEISQNRILEKRYIESSGIQVVPYAVINSIEDISILNNNKIDSILPGLLKTACLGYDSKGQIEVCSVSEIREAYEEIGRVPCVLEKIVPIKYEVSALIARSFDGKSIVFPLAENTYYHRILSMTVAPAPSPDDSIVLMVRKIATQIADRLKYVGMLCVEFFILEDNSIIVNEIAPRPHNSGHYTIDACATSQFEQQVRTMTRMPLGSPLQHSAAAMVNILGDIWFPSTTSKIDSSNISANRTEITPPWDNIIAIPTAHLHLYGKQEVRIGRKMGHINFTASTLDEAVRTAALCMKLLSIQLD